MLSSLSARSSIMGRQLNSNVEIIERSRMTKPRKEWLLTPEVARKSLENFVVRARRVEAHSLVKSGEVDRLAE